MSKNPMHIVKRFAPSWTVAILAAAAFLAAGPLAAQQTGRITGTVVAGTTGEPLAEAQVSVRGTGIGTLTTGQGRFLLNNVPVGTQTVSVTLIGYGQETQQVTVTAGGTAIVDFNLRTTAVELEGVVVTGTATQAQRREIGNSIELITAEDIEASGAVTMDDVLRGNALGMQVQGESGMAGAGSQVLLRGLGSLLGRNRPLIYIDGIRMNDRGAYESGSVPADQAATVLNSINPSDIDRIEIIKGAAASALYGTEASAGVIQIFTKRGSAGERRWTFSVEQGFAVPKHVGPESDPTGLHLNDCTFGGPLRPDQTEPDPGCPSSGSWLRNAWSQEYGLQVRGGSQDFNYFGSANWGRQEGIANVPDQYDLQAANNLNVRANFTFNPAENLQLRVNNGYTRRDIVWIPDGDNSRGFTENVIKLDEGETPGNVDSLVFQLDADQRIDHFTTGLNLQYTPTDYFRHRLNLGLDWSESLFIQFRPLEFWDFPDGARTHDVEQSRLITVDYAGSWYSELPGPWTSTLEWGGQYNDREDRGMRVDCAGPFVAPGERVVNECARSGFEGGGLGLQEDRRGFRNGGAFLQERVGWNNRLFLTAGVRADAFSQINSELDLEMFWVFYPRLQVAYTVSDHDFWPEWWETFRLRAAWGESGDPPDQDAKQTLWQIAGADELPSSGFIIQTLANPDIQPERTSEFEAGVDASIWNGRVSVQATGFFAKTTDGFIPNPLLPSGGVVETIVFNEGEWNRWGIETGLDVAVIERRDLRASVNAQYEWSDNEMVSLGRLGQGDPQSVFTSFNQRFTEGQPFPQFWGNPVSNVGELALPQRDTLQNLGRSIPNQQLSLGVSVTYQNRLTLDVSGSGQFGHLVLDEGAEEAASVGVWPQCVGVDDNLLDHVFNDAPLEFTADKIARCSEFNSVGGVALDDQNEDWLFPGDYFRIRSASLTYRVPEDWLPGAFTGATVQFRATNLALITDYPTGTDPDALLGAATFEIFRSGGFTLPPPRTYSLNLRVNF